ncbi:MAG: SH3 domain-containing protein [Rhodospirillales bacterium]
MALVTGLRRPGQRPIGYPASAAATARLAAALVIALSVGAAGAAEKKTTTFLGQAVTPLKGTYLVVKDVNVRAKPATKSKKVGSYKAGERINVVARAKGAWVAVRDGGKDVGFVYDRVLMPLIDGTLTGDLTGKVEAQAGPACEYRIRFVGKSPVEGQLFEIADYDVLWKCTLDGKPIKFRTPMFITEAPYQLNQKRIYQVSVDVLDLYDGVEDVFSTITLYDQEKGRVAFDSVSLEKYGRAPKTKEAKAGTVAEALDGAVRIAVSSWNRQAWTDLAKNISQ